jgi:hypothetical protein
VALEMLTTSRTIVVTAMSGVAATLLLGETTTLSPWSESEGDNSRTNYSLEETRLVIIDEISFASKNEVCKIHKNLCLFVDEIQKKFGGMNL